MKTITIILPLSGKSVPVELERKKMKTCRLKVYPGQRVKLSIPTKVSTKWAESFLREKSGWIETKLELFQQAAGEGADHEIRTGRSTKLLGEDTFFSISEAAENRIYQEGGTIYIGTRTPEDQEKIKAAFEAWWRGQAKAILEDRVDQWYPVIEPYGVERPRVAVRKMRTLWGSCSVHRHVVTFNFDLIKAHVSCVDYIVLHELAHFIHPNHSRQFYDFLGRYMPDWKERKRILNQSVIPGV